ncbi:MAG: 50S ribosomal protein L21, partial [Rhodococcus sp. (in: high G+C Gram-positive bacteria)]
LVVDGSDLTTDADKLAKISVASEIVEHTKGPKIRIHKFKNKTGYHKRQGHRQKLTVLKVTGIK